MLKHYLSVYVVVTVAVGALVADVVIDAFAFAAGQHKNVRPSILPILLRHKEIWTASSLHSRRGLSAAAAAAKVEEEANNNDNDDDDVDGASSLLTATSKLTILTRNKVGGGGHYHRIRHASTSTHT